MDIKATQAQELTFDERIAALCEIKNAHTDIKIQRYGYFDTDDHGYIPWDEQVPFEPVSDHPTGGVWGIRSIGENFFRWLKVHPVYINPMSSMAGAWIYKGIPGVGGWRIDSMGAEVTPAGPRKDDGQHFRSWRPEDRPLHLVPLHQQYNIYSPGIGAANHLAPDMRIGLELGWGGILAKIRRYREANRPLDTSFYDGEEHLVLGIQTWIRRHVDQARAMAATEEHPDLRENLEKIAETNEWLIDNPPRTFREACQFIAWFQCVDRMWALGGALDQIDELLLPYYERDIAAGVETYDSCVWHVASLFFNDPHYSQIGGQGPDGRDLTSTVSFIVLDAMHKLRIPSNIALRVHENMDRALLRQAIQYIYEDGTGVSFALSKGLDEGFARQGFPLGLARMRAKTGCNWTALPGIEYCLQDVTRACLVTPLLMAFEDIINDPHAPRSMDSLWDRYTHHLKTSVDIVKEGKDLHMERQADNWPEIVLNLFCHGTIERGLDASAGGVDIVDLAMDGIGLATAADSFAAIEQRVVNEERLTWEELAEHLASNFEGAERVRMMLNGIPHYGAGGTIADVWAERIAELWTRLVAETPTPRGFRCVPGLFSHGGTNKYGETVGATPNGRLRGEPVSHSADPDPGFMPGTGIAITAKANAVASVQSGYGNTTPLQIEIDQKLIASLGGVEALEALILGHNQQGGTLINMNVLRKEDVIEAHQDPMTHPDLMIRVTGYSAYFRSLSKEYRQPIVDRILAESD